MSKGDLAERVIAAYRLERNILRASRIVGIDQSRVSRILKENGVALEARPKPPKPIRPHRPPSVRVKMDEPAPEGAVPFEKLTAETCRYPFGRRPPFLFCGAETRTIQRHGETCRDVYCAAHAALCFRPVKERADVTL